MAKTTSIALVPFSGGGASTLAGPLEVLSFAAKHHAETHSLDISIVTEDGKPVSCSEHVKIEPTGSMQELDEVDLVFLTGSPCSVARTIGVNSPTAEWLQRLRKQGTEIATVCPSQTLLADAGVLNEKTVAMHWSLIEEARMLWPKINWTADRMVVEDHGIYSCCGAGGAVDLTLYLIDRLLGQDAMISCAQWFVTDLPRVRQDVPPPTFGRSKVGGDAMAPVESWMLGHFHEQVNFEHLARKFGMSWRTFYRHFNETFGDPPKVYLQKLRLNAARHMLETDAGQIDQIASKVGYADPAFFRKLFKRHVGMTPSRYRDNFRFRSMV